MSRRDIAESIQFLERFDQFVTKGILSFGISILKMMARRANRKIKKRPRDSASPPPAK